MADFCTACTYEHFGEQYMIKNDMRHSEEGTIYTLCEGCPGWFEFDQLGRRLPLSDACPHGVPWDQCRVIVHKENLTLAYVSDLNFHGVGEFIARYSEGDMSSDTIADYEPTCTTWKVIDRALTP